jgi:hypothetical protein
MQPGLDRFEATLASRDSATAALGEWCRVHHFADPPTIQVRRVMGPQVPPSTAVREALAVGASEPIAYRDVQLTCGVHVLSVAQNWYVPSRLAPAMNEALETSDRPFGSVVAPIRFTRERLSSKRGAAEGCAPDTLLSQRGLLRLPDGRPISLVIECYTRANLPRG